MAGYMPDLEAPLWRAVRQLYMEDKVVEAYKESESLGGSRSDNSLFAEAEARIRGTQYKTQPWLTIEAITDEIGPALDAVLAAITRDCTFCVDSHTRGITVSRIR